MKKLILISAMMVFSLICFSQTGKWNKTLKKNTIEEYQKFLDKYPESEYSDEAKQNLIKLEFNKAEYKYSISAYEEFIKKYPNNEFATDAESWILAKQQTRINSLNKIKDYTVGVTTIQTFGRDGWNAEDPWMGEIGIVRLKKTPQKSEYVLGICANHNPSKAKENSEMFSFRNFSDNYSYNVAVMSKKEIKYTSGGGTYMVGGKDVTDYIATLVFENDILVSVKRY